MFKNKQKGFVPLLTAKYNRDVRRNDVTWKICLFFLLISIPIGIDVFSMIIFSFFAYDALFGLKLLRIDIKTKSIITMMVVGLNFIAYIISFIIINFIQ